MNTTVQIIHKDGHPEWAVIPYAEYERISLLAEDQEDIRAFDEAMNSVESGEELIPSVVVNRLADGEAPLKVWREYRGFSPKALAELTGVEEARLLLIESGTESGSAEWLASLANALRVDVDELAE